MNRFSKEQQESLTKRGATSTENGQERASQDDAANGELAAPTRFHASLVTAVPGFLLFLILATNIPLLVCMPLWTDVEYYDVSAHNLLNGGVHYRDVFDNNFPGMVVLHVAIRYVLGWSSEAIRTIDLLVVGLTGWLLLTWLRPGKTSLPGKLWGAIALAGYYASLGEENHCQRDFWMLLPAVIAACIRRRQMERMFQGEASQTLFRWALLEGLCWGAGIWIKPFVILPAAVVWAVATTIAYRAKADRRLLQADFAGLLAGGILAGLLGLAGLFLKGELPGFWDWAILGNAEYQKVAANMSEVEATDRVGLAWHWFRWGMAPWSFSVAWALPLAIIAIVRACRGGNPAKHSAMAILAALQIGWLLEALAQPYPTTYRMAPIVFPALAILAVQWQESNWPRLAWPLLLGMVGSWYLLQNAQNPTRLDLWTRCWSQGSTPEIKDGLSLQLNKDPAATNYQELHAVAEFLAKQGVRDGEVNAYHESAMHLYNELRIAPATRFVFFWQQLRALPGSRKALEQAVAAGQQRFVVVDTQRWKQPPILSEEYPWSFPVAWRGGGKDKAPRYIVFAVKKG